MKWKKFLIVFLVLLLITGAFMIPPILLRRFVSLSLNRSVLSKAPSLHPEPANPPPQDDASDPPSSNHEPADNTVQKLLCFTDPDANSIGLNLEDAEEQQLLKLHTELETLCASGAIPKMLFDFLDTAAGEDYNAEKLCIIQPEQNLIFTVFVIRFRCIDAQFILDQSSGKILGMSYPLPDEKLLSLELDKAQTNKELQGWADYLGLVPGRISRTELGLDDLTSEGIPDALRTPVTLKQIILTDESQNSVPFFQTYTVTNYFTWGAY